MRLAAAVVFRLTGAFYMPITFSPHICSFYPAHTREDQAHLLNRLCKCLGASSQWTRPLEQQLYSLLRGLRWLESRQPSATPWRQAIQQIIADKSLHPHTAPAPLTRLGVLLARQPALTDKVEVEVCMGVGAAVTIHEMMGVVFPAYLIEGLTQLFSSQRQTWSDLRRQLSNEIAPSAAISPGSTPTSTARFLAAAVQLLHQTLPPPPKLPPAPLDAKRRIAEAMDMDATTDGVVSAKAGDQTVSRFDTNRNLFLFQFQCVQQEQEPALNRYRLINDWNSLTDGEFEECCQILNRQLHAPPESADGKVWHLHAACRFVSILAQLSLEIAASLPLGRQGSMHLDLRCGILRRDLQVIAPRTDRTQGQLWRRRWLRTPIPPQVLQVLRTAFERVPQATTLGDLLVHEGLTPRACHQLVNRGRRQSRTFESLRIARSLRSYLLRHGTHPSVVSRTTGDTSIVPKAQHYYLLLPQQRVHDAVNDFCVFAGLQPVAPSHPDTVIGSPKACTLKAMRAAFMALQQEVIHARQLVTTRSPAADLVQFHNRYTCLVALQMLWSVGARCQNIPAIAMVDICADDLAIVIADRKSDRYAQRRACPLTPAIRQTRLHYFEHLRALSHALIKQGQDTAVAQITQGLAGRNSQASAFFLLDINSSGQWSARTMSRSDLDKARHITGLSTLNVPRHFLVSHLVASNFPAVAIDALFGHHQTGAEPFGFGSGLSIQEFLQFASAALQPLHDQLGIAPLVGLGRTDNARLKLPQTQLGPQIPSPENRYLAQRLAVDDFNPPDKFQTEADCPISSITMAAKRELDRLQYGYLRSDVVRRNPWQAVAFSLIVFDLVINRYELDAFLGALIDQKEQKVGELYGVEILGEQLTVIGQCLMSRPTTDALRLARKMSSAHAVADIKSGMLELIKAIDPHWPDLSTDKTMARLQSLASHWALVMLPPLVQFSLVHKAPLIPMNDIHRIALQPNPACVPLAVSKQSARHRISGFEDVMAMVTRWANRDDRLGEYKARSHGLANELRLWKSAQGSDDADDLLIDFLLAEIGPTPPFRRLSLPVLAEYLTIQIKFFAHIRLQGDIPQSPEEWGPVIDMFRDRETEGKRHWAGLHIGAWLTRRGATVAKQLRPSPTQRGIYRPHLSVYITPQELEKAIGELFESNFPPPIAELKAHELILRRWCPFRPQETRFLQAKHHTTGMEHLLVTTSGHIHLKNLQYSRGLVALPESLRSDMSKLAARRLQSPARHQSLMFVVGDEDGFSLYDAAERAALTALKSITGHAKVRIYDLRACAISDLITDIPDGIDQLVSGRTPSLEVLHGDMITRRHARAAFAAREARQASIHTTLRYYFQGGAIERRALLNVLQHRLPRSAAYTASVLDTSVQAIYAKAYRSSLGKASEPNVALPTPMQGQATSRIPHFAGMAKCPVHTHSACGNKRIMAVLLHLSGMPIQAAADVARLPLSAVELDLPDQLAMLGRRGISMSIDLTGPHPAASPSRLEALSDWAYSHRSEIHHLMTDSPKVMRPHGNKISYRSCQGLDLSAHLWRSLTPTGILPVLFFSKHVSISELASVASKDLALGIRKSMQRLKRQKYAALKFTIAKIGTDDDQLPSSNHVIGATGRLVVAAITLANWHAQRS